MRKIVCLIVAILAGLSVKALSLSQDSVTQLVTAHVPNNCRRYA